MNSSRNTQSHSLVDPAAIYGSKTAATIWINVDIDVDFPLAAGPDMLLR